MSTVWGNPYILASPVFVFGIFYLFFLWLALLCKCRDMAHKSRQVYLFNRNTNILCFTACLICGIVDIIHLYILSFKSNKFPLQDEYNYVKAIADVLYFFASYSLSIILFGRIYFTFKDTIFALSTFTIFIISFQIGLSILLDTTYIALTLIYKEAKADKYARPMFLVLIANDFLVSLSMLYLFVYKLKELIININLTENGNIIHSAQVRINYHQQQSSSNTNTDLTQNAEHQHDEYMDMTMTESLPPSPGNGTGIGAGSRPQSRRRAMSVGSKSLLSEITAITHSQIGDRQIEFDEHQLHLIVVITRHTILSVFAIIFNQFFYVIGYMSLNSKWERGDAFGILVYGMRLIGMCGIVTALYLSMKFSKNLYYSVCKWCHLGCHTLCVKCTKKTIRDTIISR